ncbi:hypothetical protein CIRG_08418 [Coccidioides immitis RMSCC 2394]|uniref:Uncharacterized protein n=1 Tax=Coccidioides immitis RMSCC 2394 TaxID=404692 RepID=A0A0J7BF01_COCIT|nr:hypothetical protein CIRG_08418 [Coccidioides immitis RMSCC 2394]
MGNGKGNTSTPIRRALPMQQVRVLQPMYVITVGLPTISSSTVPRGARMAIPVLIDIHILQNDRKHQDHWSRITAGVRPLTSNALVLNGASPIRLLPTITRCPIRAYMNRLLGLILPNIMILGIHPLLSLMGILMGPHEAAYPSRSYGPIIPPAPRGGSRGLCTGQQDYFPPPDRRHSGERDHPSFISRRGGRPRPGDHGRGGGSGEYWESCTTRFPPVAPTVQRPGWEDLG